jgi:hypothetical protein
VAPKYRNNKEKYRFDFADERDYSVLIDNGITDETDDFLLMFPNARVLKISYSDRSWPVVARTMIEKAMNQDFTKELDPSAEHHGHGCGCCFEPWEYREKYFLYLRDHQFRTGWRADPRFINLSVDDILHYETLYNTLNNNNLFTEDFDSLWTVWSQVNDIYIEPVILARHVMERVRSRQNFNLAEFTDFWAQAVINYYIWLEFEFEVPANDYADWFTNTDDIVKMLEQHGVSV